MSCGVDVVHLHCFDEGPLKNLMTTRVENGMVLDWKHSGPGLEPVFK